MANKNEISKLNKAAGQVFARLRKARKLTQEDMGLECGIHPSYVSKMERGEKSPTLRMIFSISRVLEKTPSEIVNLIEKQYDTK